MPRFTVRPTASFTLCAVLQLALTACGGSGSADGGGDRADHDNSGLTTTGAQAQVGVYEVPTVGAELTEAATYPVDKVDWSTTNGVLTLRYDLPKGLMGKEHRLIFSGSATPNANGELMLKGELGTARCTPTLEPEATTPIAIVCFEEMPGLKLAETDLQEVKAIAVDEYAGPAADRLSVTETFIAEPIGILRFDPAKASSDDDTGAEED